MNINLKINVTLTFYFCFFFKFNIKIIFLINHFLSYNFFLDEYYFQLLFSTTIRLRYQIRLIKFNIS
jgi:hypothetical protein